MAQKISFRIRLNTVHGVLAFAVPFFVFFPFLILFGSVKRWQPLALTLHRWWAWIFFRLLFIPVEIEWRYRPGKNGRYIFCANHFSFLDIPAMGLLNVPFKFIGKISLTKVPLFGYMYDLIHITVDRSSMTSRVKSQREVIKALDEGFNVTYFPEGGMITKTPPKMAAFKDGAFKVAVEKQVPIVPVTLVTNYKLVPNHSDLPFYRGKFKMIVHEPHFPNGEQQASLNDLRGSVREAIESGLN